MEGHYAVAVVCSTMAVVADSHTHVATYLVIAIVNAVLVALHAYQMRRFANPS